MSKITAWKGGRSERIEARITHEAKIALLARIDREGFGSFADWLEAQAIPQLTKHAPDVWDSAPLKHLSTSEVDSDLGNVPTPATRR